MKKITIGIITYMRPVGLERILNSFKPLSLNNIDLSIIVVDNDATGENQKVIDKLKKEDYPYKLDMFVERTRGIIAARNCTVREFLKTDSESLLFIDDDEWPVHNNWVEKLVEVQVEYDCDVVYSHVDIIPETDEISWVKTAYTIEYGDTIMPTKQFYTNNLFIKRHVYEELNPPFDKRFAMTGSDDVHFCLRVNNAGYKAYYTPEAPVAELFPLTRASLKWFFLRGYRSGEGSTKSHIYESKGLASLSGYILYKFVGRFVRAIEMFAKSLFTLDKGYFARGCTYVGATIGTVAGIFGWEYNEYTTTHGK